jgi:hypothetical protein
MSPGRVTVADRRRFILRTGCSVGGTVSGVVEDHIDFREPEAREIDLKVDV